MPNDPTNWQTPATAIAHHLAYILSDDLSFATNLFIGHLPSDPVNCFAVFDSGGGEQMAGQATDTHHIQIICRNSSYKIGYNLLHVIKNILQSSPTIYEGTEAITGIWVISTVTFIGRDKLEYPNFSLNLRVMIDTDKNVNRMPEESLLVIGGGDAYTVSDNVLGG